MNGKTEKLKIKQQKEAIKTSIKKPKKSKKSVKQQMQGFWRIYAEKSREKKRFDTITNNLDGVVKSNGLQRHRVIILIVKYQPANKQF